MLAVLHPIPGAVMKAILIVTLAVTAACSGGAAPQDASTPRPNTSLCQLAPELASLKVKSLELGAAVACAEHFVLANGYTAAPPIKSEFVRGPLEPGSDEEIIAFRHGSMDACAVSVCPSDLPGSIWTVAFRGNREDSSRAVLVDEGCRPRMMHGVARLYASYDAATQCRPLR